MDKCLKSDDFNVKYSDGLNNHKEQDNVDFHKDSVKAEPYNHYDYNDEEIKEYKILNLLITIFLHCQFNFGN